MGAPFPKVLGKVLGKQLGKVLPSVGIELIRNFPLTADLLDTEVGAAVTFTRSTTKSLVKDNFTIEELSIDEAGFTGFGLHIEESHDNRCLQSRIMGSGTWTKSNATVTANNETAPNGLMESDKIEATNINSNTQQTYAIDSGTDFTVYFWAKYGDVQYVNFQGIDDASTGDRVKAWFDIQNGTVGTVSTTGSGFTVLGSGISSSTFEGHYLCHVSFATVGITDLRHVYFASSADNSVVTAVGDYYNIWGSNGLRLAHLLTPVATVSSLVTMASDAAEFDASSIPSNDYQIYCEAKLSVINSTTAQTMFNCKELVAVNGDKLCVNTSGDFLWSRTANSVTNTATITTTAAIDTVYKILLTMDSTTGMTIEVDGIGTNNNANTTSFSAGLRTDARLGADNNSPQQEKLDGAISNFKWKSGTGASLLDMSSAT